MVDVAMIAVGVARLVGRSSIDLEPAAGGASRHGFLASSGADRWYVRVDDGTGGLTGSPFDLRREAAVLRAVRRAGIAVPDVLGELDTPPTTVLEFVDGTNAPRDDQIGSTSADYVRQLVAVHAVDPAALPFHAFSSTSDAVADDVRLWRGIATSAGVESSPLVAAALQKLESSLPANAAPPALVHGDAGPGNFLIRDGIVTALLDWEMAHLGDPLEDLAWIWIRSVHSPFASMRDTVDAYRDSSGREVDLDVLWWHLTAVLTKTVIGLRAALARRPLGEGFRGRLRLTLVYEALLAWSLSRASGAAVDLLDVTPTARPTELDPIVQRMEEVAQGPANAEARALARTLGAALSFGTYARADGEDVSSDISRMVADRCRWLHIDPGAVALIRHARSLGLGSGE